MSIRHTEKECGYPHCAWNTSRLAYDGLEVCPVTRKKSQSLCIPRQEKDITVTCRHRIISEQDILSENFKTPSGNGKGLLEAKVPSVKRRTSCVYADLKELHLQMEILKAA